jgi:hypothetical protein
MISTPKRYGVLKLEDGYGDWAVVDNEAGGETVSTFGQSPNAKLVAVNHANRLNGKVTDRRSS